VTPRTLALFRDPLHTHSVTWPLTHLPLHTILTGLFPHSQIDIYVQVWGGLSCDPLHAHTVM